MCDTPHYFEPTIFKTGFLHLCNMSCLFDVEDKKTDADTHLADARRQNMGNGISGDLKNKRS